ncbi:acetyltransferase (GNAT) family protein [Dokdonia sp. MED134]|uniref:GNAT family N-acetyltransferase n=1 Tax=Dokdonia sp. MED134 TaxID=313590 RepID=UPI0000689BD0|nr:GNAT family N-acetyltransferase [Dokdonia sp. MED134]EAQ38286.1 acetyltransferase (GNAT) family protein [Dokdonia sp. MED134]
MHIRQATLTDLEFIIPLFDGYRQFYKQPSDIEGARSFLKERFAHNESTIYVAHTASNPQELVGFTQVYPLFSSVSMERMLLLNDLYIHPDHRGKGIGTLLINRVKELCTATGHKGIALQTGTTNPAQKLYERLGFTKDPDLHYFWAR